MKARLKYNVDILDTGKIVNAMGKILKMNEMEMEITKMFKDGTPFTPIKNYILKHYKIDKAEYQKRFISLIARLTRYNFIESNTKII